MRGSTLEALTPLLNILRSHPALREVRTATFLLNGRNFVHFHEEPEGVFADVLLAKGRVHMPVSSPREQAQLMEQIDRVLASLEQRERGRRLKGHLESERTVMIYKRGASPKAKRPRPQARA